MSAYMGEEEVIRLNRMTSAQEQLFTVEDIEALPEDERVELIDGRIYYMAAPSRTHQRLLIFLTVEIESYIRNHKGKCQVYIAPFALYLNEDNSTYLEPDLMVVCDRDKTDEKGCHGAPDLVMEIVSPSTRSRDYLLKLNKYQHGGVREYWIPDTERDVIQVYDLGRNQVESYGFGDKIKVGIFPDLSITVPPVLGD